MPWTRNESDPPWARSLVPWHLSGRYLRRSIKAYTVERCMIRNYLCLYILLYIPTSPQVIVGAFKVRFCNGWLLQTIPTFGISTRHSLANRNWTEQFPTVKTKSLSRGTPRNSEGQESGVDAGCWGYQLINWMTSLSLCIELRILLDCPLLCCWWKPKSFHLLSAISTSAGPSSPGEFCSVVALLVNLADWKNPFLKGIASGNLT